MTLRNAPLSARDGGSSKVDLPDMLSGIFFQTGLDRKSVICPSGKIISDVVPAKAGTHTPQPIN
jgi:hypothetical protein